MLRLGQDFAFYLDIVKVIKLKVEFGIHFFCVTFVFYLYVANNKS